MYEILDDLKQIKKDYGEQMMYLCRRLFPTILETPGLLYKVLREHFAKSRDLYSDIVSEHKEYIFKEYIYSFVDIEREKEKNETKTVKELLDKAGYKLFECKTNEDIQMFKKYYIEKEELCTFRDSHRIEDHHIFFIVKKDVDKIRREDFKEPRREDAYSTSVLDLQFDKGKRQRVSIKSRYNHTVTNPDATYSNNLDLIIPGLTDAFEKDYGFNIGSEYKTNFELEDYVQSRDGKLYKYNYEINNIHYCPNNIIIDNGNVIYTYAKEPERYLFVDYFILDLKEKKIFLYDKKIIDSFIDGLQNITNLKITNKEGYKEVRLILEENKEVIINLDKRGRIIGYTNNYLEECENNFLSYNKVLNNLNLSNLRYCGCNFLGFNELLQDLSLPNLRYCRYNFLGNNPNLISLNLPNLEKCENRFLENNQGLTSLNLPKLIRCENDFLYFNHTIETLNLPLLKECGERFLYFNKNLQSLSLPKLKECGDNFMSYNEILTDLNLPELIRCGNSFLNFNIEIKRLSLPNLMICGFAFLCYNTNLTDLNLPELLVCGCDFLHHNVVLTNLNLPKLEECGSDFLSYNQYLQSLSLPKLKECGEYFLDENQSLQSLSLPNLREKYYKYLEERHILLLNKHNY